MNHFDYFSDIEERFVARRGSALLLSPLDWALIETWHEAGVPLAAALRGIDTAFDRFEVRQARAGRRLGKVNGLAWCAQAVMQAASEMAEASVGLRSPEPVEGKRIAATGFEAERIAAFLESNAAKLELAKLPTAAEIPTLAEVRRNTAARLRELAAELRDGAPPALEELDRNLTVLEDRLHAILLAGMEESALLQARAAVEAELAPVRTRLGAVQLRQMREQMLHRRIFLDHSLPRLSLFHMPMVDGPAETM